MYFIAVQALESHIGFCRPSWILLEKLENTIKKKYQAHSPGPICLVQIFGNNLSRGFRVREETKCGGGVNTIIFTVKKELDYKFFKSATST